MGRLDIRICEARNLPDTQVIGKPDPYCIVRCENQQHKTRVLDDQLNPKWEEVFKFQIADEHSAQLRFELWNKNLTSDELLGMYTLSISGLKKGLVDDRWYLLQKCKGNAELRIRMCALDFGVDPTPMEKAQVAQIGASVGGAIPTVVPVYVAPVVAPQPVPVAQQYPAAMPMPMPVAPPPINQYSPVQFPPQQYASPMPPQQPNYPAQGYGGGYGGNMPPPPPPQQPYGGGYPQGGYGSMPPPPPQQPGYGGPQGGYAAPYGSPGYPSPLGAGGPGYSVNPQQYATGYPPQGPGPNYGY